MPVSRPHIALFSLAYTPFFGGAEVAASEIIQRLQHRFRFTCLTYQFDAAWPAEEDINGVHVIRVRAPFFLRYGSDHYYGRRLEKFFYPLLACWAALRVHRRDPFQMTWAMMAAYGGAAALLFKLFYSRISLFLTLQEGDDETHIVRRVGFFYPLWKLLFSRAKHIQVISRYLRDVALRHGARCPITVVPNGVGVIKRGTYNMQRENEERVIITTSRLVYKNAVDIIIRAVAELKKMTREPFQLQIVGDGPLRGELEHLAYELGVADLVRFVGVVSPSEIPNYLARAYVFIRPSRSEGLGSSFLEAMAAGVPIIGTAVGGIPDFLNDRETGLIMRVDDVHDCVQKILQLFEDHVLYERLCKNGLALVQRDYQWDTIAATIGQLFHKTIYE